LKYALNYTPITGAYTILINIRIALNQRGCNKLERYGARAPAYAKGR
jgi:hypothetical protein